LVLRNQIDAGTKPTVGARKVDILGPKEPVPAPVVAVARWAPKLPPRSAPEAEKDKVEIIRGLSRSYATGL